MINQLSESECLPEHFSLNQNSVKLSLSHVCSNTLQSCKSRGIKLCGALAAAGLIAARSSKDLPDDQREKYAVVTLIDCRSILEPPLSSSHLGKLFFQAAETRDYDNNLFIMLHFHCAYPKIIQGFIIPQS